jgi:hypothetical protein
VEGLHVIGKKVFQLKNESSMQGGGVLSNTKKKKTLECFMCRQFIQHNFEVGQYNKPFA